MVKTPNFCSGIIPSTVQAPPHSASAAGAYYRFKRDGPNSVVGLNYWHMMWHYNATKTEKQNLQELKKWWCSTNTDIKGKSPPKDCNNEPVRNMKDFMDFIGEHTMQIISIKVTEFWASHQNDPHDYETIHKAKTTKEDIMKWFLTAYGKDGRTQRLYERYEKLAFHSDKRVLLTLRVIDNNETIVMTQ